MNAEVSPHSFRRKPRRPAPLSRPAPWRLGRATIPIGEGRLVLKPLRFTPMDRPTPTPAA